MNKNLIVRSLAAVSGLAMLASLAACGDNVAATTDSTSTKDLRRLRRCRCLLPAGRC